MGRYLDMARETQRLAGLPECSPKPLGDTWPLFPLPATSEPTPAEDDFDCLASFVLEILTKATQPVSHSGIVKALVERVHDKTEAKQAIARCQKWGWIEHDLLTGYVLSAKV